MTQKMQIAAFSVNKYQSSKIFVDSKEKNLGSVLFSRDDRITVNIHIFFLTKVEVDLITYCS